MGKVINYLTITAATVAAAVNLWAANPDEERKVAEYLRNNLSGIVQLTIDSVEGKRVNAILSSRNIDGRDILFITQPSSSEDAKKYGLELPSGTLGMYNNEWHNDLDGIINLALLQSENGQVPLVLNLADKKLRNYIQSIYDYTIRQAYAWVKSRSATKAN